MKLLIALITYDRLAYTKQTLRTLLDTIQVPYYLVIVDNASTDGTQRYLENLKERGRADMVVFNEQNYYPGKAANIGWAVGLKAYPQATHLARIDNDMHFERGWDLKAVEYFDTIDRLGQLGLDYDGGEGKVGQFYNGMELNEFPGCVGGPNIIRREVFDKGLRYDETPWEGSNTPLQEDSRFSKAIKGEGWLVGHMAERLSWTFATPENWHDYKSYYMKTMRDRGYEDRLKDAGLL